MIFTVLFLLGMGIYRQSVYCVPLPEGKICYSAIACNTPLRHRNSFSVDCLITGYECSNKAFSVREKVRIFFTASADSVSPEIGDSLSFRASLSKVRNRGNPEEFDYAGYLQNQGIYYTGYVREDDLHVGNGSGKYILRSMASRIRLSISRRFEAYGISGDKHAVLAALVTGNRQFIDRELKDQYASAGVMHILAVSGLHVGILYLFLSMILFRNRNQRFFRIVRLIIIMSFIWGYAFITGMSASVMRASFMFSLFLAGKNFNRPADSYNILAASVFLLLLIDPAQLFHVGFQFSHLAVLGIVFFQPRIENLLLLKNGIADRIWQLVTVSIAAQITTFPLTLFYFHQFPLYFWLSNILVIPAVWLIMVCALLFLVFSFFTPLAMGLSACLKGLLFLLNQSIAWISRLPLAVIENIRFQEVHVLVFMLMVFLLIVITKEYRVKRYLFILISAIAFLLLADLITFRVHENRKEFIVYSLGDNLAISIIQGHKHLLLVDTQDPSWEESRKYLRPYWISREIDRDMTELCLDDTISGKWRFPDTDISLEVCREGYGIKLGDQEMFILSDRTDGPSTGNSPSGEAATWVVFDRSGFPGKYNPGIHPEKMIVTGAMGRRKKQAWKEFAGSLGIRYYDVEESGALHDFF
jgi:competence protein ComEC